MRLIDADAAKLAVGDCKTFRCQSGGLMDVVEFLDDQPTIDAIPVVRCKDCLYWKSGENASEKWEYCTLHCIGFGPHAFCSYGERREDKHD